MTQNLIIDLMRHGEPVGGRRYRGQTDDALSERGWQQMRDAVGIYAGWQRIVTSPLQRCAAFADSLGEKLAIPVTREERFKEMGFGEWEGKLPAEICSTDPQRLLRFRLDPVAHAPPGAEPVALFHARCVAAWQELLAGQDAGNLLIVAHAGVIRMLLSHVLGLEPRNAYRIEIGNAGITRVRIEREAGLLLPVLVFHNRDMAEAS